MTDLINDAWLFDIGFRKTDRCGWFVMKVNDVCEVKVAAVNEFWDSIEIHNYHDDGSHDSAVLAIYRDGGCTKRQLAHLVLALQGD